MKRCQLCIVKIVNKTKGGNNALQNRLFENFLKEFGATFEDIRLYTEVKLTSHVDCLDWFFELRHALQEYIQHDTKVMIFD